MRKLASIRLAGDLFPVIGADLIEAVKVDGWVCVVKKGEFKPGDLGVYFEIDSFLPSEDSRFSFLNKQFINFEGSIGARLRTIRLRGQLSQGLFLPLKSFPELNGMPVGSDVTNILKIKKWEAEIPEELIGMVKGGFPSFITKTDIERIQNLVVELSEQIGQEYEISTKLDGTSMTVYRYEENDDNNKVLKEGVCGKNWEYIESDKNPLWSTARKSRLLEALAFLNKNYAFQGELIGQNIQSNPEKIKGHNFYIFNIFDIDNYSYLSPTERMKVIKELQDAGFEVSSVPIVDSSWVIPEDVTVTSLLEMADGPSLNPDIKREGLVFKRKDGNFIFKVISNWYLEKNSDR